MTIAAVILAAGAGSRFEGDTHKLLAPLRGRAVIAWAVQHAVDASFDETIVVTGAADLTGLLPDAVRVVPNPRWADGQATSVQAAVAYARAMGHDAIVIGLGDTPFIPAETWRLVGDAASPLAVAVIDGQRTPPVRLAASMWDDLPVEGDAGARSLLARRPDLVLEVTCPGAAADIDTQEDLQPWT